MWNDWKKENPKPGEYVYVRNFNSKENLWDIGWTVGEDGDTKVMIVTDPSWSQIKFDEWQYVPGPLEQ